MRFPASIMKVDELGYELLFKVGDDPLSELAELDHFFKWSYRIRKLRGLFEKKRSYLSILIYTLAVALAFSCGILVVLYLQYRF
jgi:hypothetical protein